MCLTLYAVYTSVYTSLFGGGIAYVYLFDCYYSMLLWFIMWNIGNCHSYISISLLKCIPVIVYLVNGQCGNPLRPKTQFLGALDSEWISYQERKKDGEGFFFNGTHAEHIVRTTRVTHSFICVLSFWENKRPYLLLLFRFYGRLMKDILTDYKILG